MTFWEDDKGQKPDPWDFDESLLAPKWKRFCRGLHTLHPLWNSSKFAQDLSKKGASLLVSDANTTFSPTALGGGLKHSLNGSLPPVGVLKQVIGVPMTIFCVMRLDAAFSSVDREVYELQSSSASVRRAGIGWDNTEVVFGVIRLQSGTAALTGTTIFSAGDIVKAALVVRSNTDHELFVNGISEATSSTDIASSLTYNRMQIHGGLAPATLIMGASWSRALPTVDIIQLSDDPFGLVRMDAQDELRLLGVAAAVVAASFPPWKTPITHLLAR